MIQVPASMGYGRDAEYRQAAGQRAENPLPRRGFRTPAGRIPGAGDMLHGLGYWFLHDLPRCYLDSVSSCSVLATGVLVNRKIVSNPRHPGGLSPD